MMTGEINDGNKGGNDRPRARWLATLRRSWVWIAFFVLVVLPIYGFAVAAFIRSGLFKFSGASLTNDQFKAIWIFLAAGLAATATILGALLTKSHNDRTLASEIESKNRQQLLVAETNERLVMDTVINSLSLIAQGESYSSKAAVAGGLATLVQLGHPIVAMRALSAALPDGVIDKATAAWLIGQALTATKTKGTEDALTAAKEEAAQLLLQYARTFTRSDSDRAEYSWPEPLHNQWPTGLPLNASINVLVSFAELLLSQTKRWWTSKGFTYAWIIYTFDEVIRHDEKAQVKISAAILGKAMLEVDDTEIFSGYRKREEIVSNMNQIDLSGGKPDLGSYCDRIRDWGRQSRAASSRQAAKGFWSSL